MALPITWYLFKRCTQSSDPFSPELNSHSRRYQAIKAVSLVVFGLTLTACYGISAAFHGVKVSGEPLQRLQRLDHIGIYLLIAGTYTPVAWGLMRGSWWWGTLTTVWTVALVCAARVWCGGMMPIWVSTLTYLAMGWAALFCYFELAQAFSHRTLMPLPLGGIFYSVGAVLNLTKWPALVPGVFAAHEIFHFLVIAGSACHIFFMHQVVIPSPRPPLSRGDLASSNHRPSAPISQGRDDRARPPASFLERNSRQNRKCVLDFLRHSGHQNGPAENATNPAVHPCHHSPVDASQFWERFAMNPRRPVERETSNSSPLQIYLHDINSTPLLSAQEERALAELVAMGDPLARAHGQGESPAGGEYRTRLSRQRFKFRGFDRRGESGADAGCRGI